MKKCPATFALAATLVLLALQPCSALGASDFPFETLVKLVDGKAGPTAALEILPGEQKTLELRECPKRPQGKYLALMITARVHSEVLGGDNAFLAVDVNDRPIVPDSQHAIGAWRRTLMREKDSYSFARNPNRLRPWYHNGAWRLPYAPDFDSPGGENDPYRLAQPVETCTYCFNVTDRLKPDGANRIAIRNAAGIKLQQVAQSELRMVVQTVALGTVPRPQKKGTDPLAQRVGLLTPTRLEVTLALLQEPEGKLTATLEVYDGGGDDLLAMAEAGNLQQTMFDTVVLDVSKAEPGRPVRLYTTAIEEKADGARSTWKVLEEYVPLPRKPEWMGSNAGIIADVPPPWPPVEVHGDLWRCWNRDFTLGPALLPRRITSGGEDLLASPVELRYRVSGRAGSISLEHGKLLSQLPRRCSAFRHGLTPVGRVVVNAALEFDGLLRYDVTVYPRDEVEIEELTLDVPVANGQARLGHYNRASWLSDSAFAIGAEPGWQWVREFEPCIWIGNESRGLTWYAESAQGWRPESADKAVEISREADATHFRIHFIGRPSVLDAPLKVSFGLQPTPVKPYPPARVYRNWRIAHWNGGNSSGSAHGYTMDVEGARRVGVRAVCIHSYWADFFSSPRPYARRHFKEFVRRCHAAGIKVIPYFSLTGLGVNSPEYKQYGREWALIPGWAWAHGRRYTRPSQYANSVCTASSWADYIADGIRRLALECDIDGVYLDNSGMYPCCNPLHGCGYATEDRAAGPDARPKTAYETWGTAPADRTPTYPIWAVRKLHERVYVIFKSLNKETVISRHTSGSCVPAFFSFVDTFWTGEQYVHSKPGTALPLVKFRTEFIGNQWGVVPEYLLRDGYPFTIEQGLSLALAHDTLIRPSLPHSGPVTGEERPLRIMTGIWDIYERFGIQEAKFHPYWSAPSLAPEAPGPVKVSAHYVKGRRALVVISNLQGSAAECDFALELQSLGIDAKAALWTDAYTGERIEMPGGRFAAQLPQMGHRLLIAHTRE